ncbi:hypothetical protein VitviT2T_014222 [Vitis vinifera]|nr:uncharacterized protein LOC100852751 [Vitis vinifera]XP_010655118.1 uncharacterized protein LOC100852751 [Vitis vinifera]XP_019077481.1 uncharacterized protein LOC100852751 [Vitis vinifera]WJZ95452.1 hypothetical protein VitviT2T_014222 [Vitis vinifera]|eukprot:XP_003632907.1 PREDICTED: uncharacterized protein LOC100852751 [Vitis vinifera]
MDSRFLTNTQSRITYFSPSSSNLSYFQQQALQAGMNGVYLTRSEYVRGGVGTREMIQCEIEKEQIREEIIGAEIAQLCMLEAKCRREILMNRDSALQMSLEFLTTMHDQYDGTSNERLTSLAPSAVGAFNSMHQSDERLSPLAPSSVGVFNRMHEFSEKLSPLAPSAVGVFNRVHEFSEKLSPLAPSAVGVFNRMHEFEFSEKLSPLAPSAVGAFNRMHEFSEKLSPLAPSAVGVFNRMHRFGERLSPLAPSAVGVSNRMHHFGGTRDNERLSPLAPSAVEVFNRMSLEGDSSFQKELDGNKESTNVNSTIYEKKRTEGQAAEGDCEHPVARVLKKSEGSCALCQVSTTSEQSLNDHLQGKKHKSKASKLKAKKTSIGSSVSNSGKGKKEKAAKQGKLLLLQ